MEKGDGHRFSLLDKKPVHAILLIFKQVKHQYNLHYFSYHHHYNNMHYISKFWQVRILRLPFHYLPKFGKYVRWSCLLLANYLPKFGKYVHWSCLLLAKIYILASMFVGHVCYLPKFTFWQVCSLVVFVTCQNLHFGKYVRWSCLFVCYLPKFTFWQVCSLVVFVSCQNYHFGKYVRWSCLSVCLLLLAKI